MMGRSVRQISSTIRLTITGTMGMSAFPSAHRVGHRLVAVVAVAEAAEVEMSAAAPAA